MQPTPSRNFLQQFWYDTRHNPITIKELRSRMRGRRAFIVLTGYLILVSAFVLLVYATYVSASQQRYGPPTEEAGKALFGAVLTAQGFLVLIVGPAFTSGSISGEKERQTYELLRTTLMSPKTFVWGKLLSALSYVFLLVSASIPLLSIGFLLGGVALGEIFVSQLLVGVTAVTYALLGLYASSILRTTLAANVVTYAALLIFVTGIPVFMFISVALFDIYFDFAGEAIFFYFMLLLVSFNFPATVIASEAMLLTENTYFYFTETLGGWTVVIISPWILYTIFHIIIAFILYRLCLRQNSRTPIH
ncbi:MAG TPA: ABC transporter permease [Anaerolineae bacterium]|nr:ABC transporter permease [Anaerolineae bacterium]